VDKRTPKTRKLAIHSKNAGSKRKETVITTQSRAKKIWGRKQKEREREYNNRKEINPKGKDRSGCQLYHNQTPGEMWQNTNVEGAEAPAKKRNSTGPSWNSCARKLEKVEEGKEMILQQTFPEAALFRTKQNQRNGLEGNGVSHPGRVSKDKKSRTKKARFCAYVGEGTLSCAWTHVLEQNGKKKHW